MEFFDSIQQVKSNWEPYKNWKAQQDDKEFQREQLYKRINSSNNELEKASQYGRTLIESINIMDQYATDKAQDVEMASQLALSLGMEALMGVSYGIGSIIERIPRVKKYLAKVSKNSPVAQTVITLVKLMALPMIGAPFLIAKCASYEKEAARTARYQAREEKLKDPKNFVVYNDEQIKKAKGIAKTLPEPKEKKRNELNLITNYDESIKSLKSIFKDHKDYLKWKEKYLKAEKNKKEFLDKLIVSPDELQEAKNDQSNLLRTVKKIEINSQNYQSNAEMALNVIQGFDIFVGPIIGGIASGTIALLKKAKIISAKSKYADVIQILAPVITPILLIVATASYAAKIQKEVARIGRFKAKQELLNDPHNFINYSDEQLDSVKDLKAPVEPKKNLTEKVKDNIKFFFQLKKDYEEYQKYQKTTYKEEQKLQEALKDIEVTDKQLEKAKLLQKNTFKTFEKIDEMSQRYVADVEAAANMGTNALVSGTNMLSQVAFAYLLTKQTTNTSNLNNIAKSFYPLLAPIAVKIPAEITSINIQKEACKIGIMKAMQDLDDPRYFVKDDN